MSAVKNSCIKKAIAKVDDEKRKAASLFFITDSKTKEKISFNLLIVKKDTYTDDTPVKYVMSHLLQTCQFRRKQNSLKLPKEYRARCIIQISFRTAKDDGQDMQQIPARAFVFDILHSCYTGCGSWDNTMIFIQAKGRR